MERNRRDGKTQLGRVPLSNSYESALIDIFTSDATGCRAEPLCGIPSAQRFRATVYLITSMAAAPRASWEKICVQGEKLAHGSRPYVFLWDNDGIAGVKASVLEAGIKDRLSRAAAGHRSVRPQNKDLSMVRVAVWAACHMKVLANTKRRCDNGSILIEHGADHLNGGGNGGTSNWSPSSSCVSGNWFSPRAVRVQIQHDSSGRLHLGAAAR